VAGADAPPLAPGDFLILCNPHNPTGRLLTPAEVLAIVDATPATVLVDEAFINLTDPGEEGSVIPYIRTRPNLVVIRSLTKFYAMPGLRVGYAVAPPGLVGRLDAVRDPWSVSDVAQAAALAALADWAYAQRIRDWVRAERPFLAEHLSRLPGYSVARPSANFILVRASEPAHIIQEKLGPQGILVRDCRSFAGLSEYDMRLAVRTRADNLRLLTALDS
jgi:threonine-phosphate decarboxylase